ncbi:MAG: sugar ABC transporter substrate-binding protein [Lachnospiraceae bacterium]|nr:sugar ABC transporter substrate-binding protein [Lachnospiraceae bacterium]
MKLKKVIVIALASVMTFSMAGCGSQTSESAAPAADSGTEAAATEGTETATVSPDTLTVAVWDKNQEPGLTQIVNDFTAETGIKAQIQVTPWEQYWTMLEAGATGGSLPDVFWMHSNEITTYSEYEMLLDLTDRISSSETLDMSKFPKEIVEIYNYDGKQFAVPKDYDTIALWYNKTMFDEAGITYPDDTWTWDDFADACKKLTKEDGSQYGYALKPSNNQDGWYNMVYDMGGEIITPDRTKSGMDEEGTIKALEFVSGLVKDGYTPAYEVMTENNPEALFEAGKVGMITMGSWMLAELCNNDYVKANCDIAVLPKDTATGRRASIYNGLGWAAAANTDKPDEAWALIEYLGSQKAQQKQSDLGIVISAYEGSETNWVKAYPDFNLQAYLDMTEDMVIRPYSKHTTVWEDMISEKLIEAWNGTKEVKDICAEIATEMNADIAEE